MKKSTRILCLVLVLAMCAGLAACGSGGTGAASGAGGAQNAAPGGKSAAATPTPEYVYTADYETLTEETQSYIAVRETTDDGFYYTLSEKVGTEAPKDRTPQYEGEFDIYQTRLYFMDNKGKSTRIESYEPIAREIDTENRRDFSSGSDMSGICFTDDGFVTIENRYSSWVTGDANYVPYSEDYWAHQTYNQEYYIRWFDKDGEELSLAPVEVDPDSWLDAYRMLLDDKGNVVVSCGQGLRAIAPDGSDAYSIQTNGYIDGILRLRDGRIACVIYDDKQLLCVLDTDSRKLKDGMEIRFDSYNAITGSGDYDLFYSNGSSLYGYKLGEYEGEKILNWLSCDVKGSDLSVLSVDGDGTVKAISNTWQNKDESYRCELITARKVPYDSVPHKETITLAVMYLDNRVQDLIVDFNRRNDKVRIEVQDYSEYNNERDGWDAGQTKLNTEILSGKLPDIFCLNGLNYRQLAAKGLLEDLYPYIDKDKELKRSDFFENVLKAVEVDGKLCATVPGFYISSAIGAASVVGDEPGWTYEQFHQALDGMRERVPECTAFDQYVTRDGILNSCLALDMADFVDWSTGQVSFDSEQFVKLLNFAAEFPAEYDWENMDDSDYVSTEDRLAQGKQMLVQTSAFSIEDIFYNNYTQFLGGKITYIGYPCVHGTGNMLSFADSGYAMSSKSAYKDEVWKFLRSFFTETYQEEGYALPTRIDVFEAQAEDAVTVKYEKDQDGKYTLDENGEKIPIVRYTMWNVLTNEPEEITHLEPEQVQQIRELIETTTKLADYDAQIQGIVSEQAQAFFSGQKSAEEVARLIQSKVNIYVNEQR